MRSTAVTHLLRPKIRGPSVPDMGRTRADPKAGQANMPDGGDGTINTQGQQVPRRTLGQPLNP